MPHQQDNNEARQGELFATKENHGINQKRIFVLDTNVLLHDSACLTAFHDSVVVIPLGVLEELDRFKTEKTELGLNARQVARTLDSLRAHGSLSEGVVLENDHNRVLVKVMATLPEVLAQEEDLPIDLLDNKIILLAKYLMSQDNRVTFVSKDINVRIKADAVGLDVEDYQQGVLQGDAYYSGWTDLIVPSSDFKQVSAQTIASHLSLERALYPNEFVVVSSDAAASKYRLFRKGATDEHLKEVGRPPSLWAFRDKNVQQHMALDLLLDDTVQLVFLLGAAGTGKTFLALLVGLFKVLEAHAFHKMLVARPLVSLGADLGYLPGDVHEKLYQWMHPVYDNLEFIFNEMQQRGHSPDFLKHKKSHRRSGSKFYKDRFREDELQYMHGARVHEAVEYLLREGMLSLEAIAYMRGRSIPQQYMFVDEVQNLTPHEVKTIISRAGAGTKVIMAGDPYQIDSPYLNFSTNGLTVTSEKLKRSPLVGSVFLTISERSALAKLAVDYL
jgi:PhoH-like ATPase